MDAHRGVTIHLDSTRVWLRDGQCMPQYRAHQNSRALNETRAAVRVFAGFGLVAYLVVVGLAFNLEHVFKITEAQAETAIGSC